ncbi:MAG: PHP domain-containing protein [Promethearchaeota archaeon]
MDKIDLHVHTTYSDGTMTIKEAIQAAKEKKLNFLAITDHFTTSWKQSIINTINHLNFKKYWTEIIRKRESFKFKCLIGIEIDIGSNWMDIKSIPFDNFDILLFEYVDSIIILKKIAKLLKELNIKTITALAHNSYYKIANIELFSKILVENNIYFELNSRYLGYISEIEVQKLKSLNDLGIRFILGSDAHRINRIGDIEKSLTILKKIDGLESLIDLNTIKI